MTLTKNMGWGHPQLSQPLRGKPSSCSVFVNGACQACPERLGDRAGALIPLLSLNLRLSTSSRATLRRWEFCGGFHAGWENRTT
jgi:hypothetical protein